MPGSSAYPAGLDSLQTNVTSSQSSGIGDHHAENHNGANAAINAIQSTLGLNPHGSAASVAARLSALAVLRVDVVAVADSPFAWNKASGAQLLDILLIGGGGGGSAGAVQAGGGIGGVGGDPGALVHFQLPASAASGTETITVGAGGSAGGTTGGVGGDTSFGSLLTAVGGIGAVAAATSKAAARTNVCYVHGQLLTIPLGGATNQNAPAATSEMPTGGGGGANNTSSGTVANAGKTGGTRTGASTIFGISAAAGGAVETAGAAGQSMGLIGMGGGGGGSSVSGTAGSGGAGGNYGGGGGGGGGTNTGGTPGGGGVGAPGIAIVIQYG